MKAIEINGVITVKSTIPSVWNNTHNYNSVNNTTQQYNDGWRDVVEPVKTDYQKNGEIYYDAVNDVFTYNVIDFTTEETEDYDENQELSDQSAINFFGHKNNGQQGFDRAMALIQRRWDNGTITGAQAKNLAEGLYPALEPLYKGLWQLVKANLDAETPPANSDLLDIFNIIKNRVDQYVLDNY